MATKAGMERVVARLEAQLLKQEAKRVIGPIVTHIQVSTLVQLSGNHNLTSRLKAQLAQAIAAAGLYYSPDRPAVWHPQDRLKIARIPFQDPGLGFASESQLSAFIVEHFRRLPPFANCTHVTEQAPYGNYFIDLLFTEAGGRRVVCELKLGGGGYGAGSQICAYIDAARAVMGQSGGAAPIRGVVVTGDRNPRQEAEVADWAKANDVQIDWYYYRLMLDLELAPLWSA